MTNFDELALTYLSRLAARPAVAFQEQGVAAVVRKILAELEVASWVDDYGNILAYLPPRDATRYPALAFMAHMDHPGFEAVAVEGDLLRAAVRGGVPEGAFAPGLPLLVLRPDGERLPAALVESAADKAAGPAAERTIALRLADPARIDDVPLPAPVVFDLPDFQLEGDFIRMRAADDLAGCGSILTLLAILSAAAEPPPGPVLGIFTRAEEVGLVGARLLAAEGGLAGDTLVVSLESSRALPGAEIGGGPVIRVGDAGFTFNAAAESALIRARETLQARPEGFRCQRQLMSGGVCEASAFALRYYNATGLAFPLGNYHNGAPEGQIAAEYIHREDYLGGITLMEEAVRRIPDRENTAFRQRLREVPEEYRQRLRATRPEG